MAPFGGRIKTTGVVVLKCLSFAPRSSGVAQRYFQSSARVLAGHSHWATIKRAKAANDLQRAAEFSKVSKAITVAVRLGGKDLAHNVALVAALSKAREVNFPKDRIETAIAKGAGEDKGGEEEFMYEGYGPHGAAFLVQGLTPNRNRSSNTIRHCFDKFGGAMGSNGTVTWMFQQRGQIVTSRAGKDEDQIMEIAVESNAEDFEIGSGEHSDDVIFWCGRAQLLQLKAELEKRGLTCRSVKVTFVPTSLAELSDEQFADVETLADALQENEDVQQVYHNATRAEDAEA